MHRCLGGRFFVFFFNDTATTEIYTLSLHDALPISADGPRCLDACLPIREGGVVERRSPYGTEPSQEKIRPCPCSAAGRAEVSGTAPRAAALAEAPPPRAGGYPSSSQPSHGSAIPSTTKMSRSKKREIASCISSWLSLASLEPEN